MVCGGKVEPRLPAQVIEVKLGEENTTKRPLGYRMLDME